MAEIQIVDPLCEDDHDREDEHGERGKRGKRGERGERGERGKRGHRGATGATGPAGGGSGSGGVFTAVWNFYQAGFISPGLWALQSDPDANPELLPANDTYHNFIVPRAVTLNAFHFKGSAAGLGTTNSLSGAIGPYPVNLHLYLNGVDQGILATIPAGTTDFDLFGTPGIALPANALLQVVVDLTPNVSGTIAGFLGSLAFN
jgi:hypothetical protein